MTRIRTWLERLADRIHEPGDQVAHANGLTVERLPGGRHRISDPRVPVWLERRRQRIARTGGDPIDRALIDGVGELRIGQVIRRASCVHDDQGRAPRAESLRSLGR